MSPTKRSGKRSGKRKSGKTDVVTHASLKAQLARDIKFFEGIHERMGGRGEQPSEVEVGLLKELKDRCAGTEESDREWLEDFYALVG